MTPPSGVLRGLRALVTGATGFIGGRLAERLLAEGVAVRALVRGYGSAVRLARLPVEIVRGEVTDREATGAAAQGCDLVFHCAYGTSGSQRHRAWVNVEGTRRVLEAGAKARRIVHLSTLMVYGRTGDGDLDETAPRRRYGNPYSDSKLAAEKLAIEAARRGQPVAVLQPTAVYGPWGGVWTASVLAALRRGRQILVDGGRGLANAVYVDDLVEAILAAAKRDEAVGEAFLVSDGAPVPWSVFYGAFERMLGGGRRTVAMSAAEARAHWRAAKRREPRLLAEALALTVRERTARERLQATREGVWLRELASRVLPEGVQQRIKARLGGLRGPTAAEPTSTSDSLPILPLAPEQVDFFVPRTRVVVAKAERLLGWRPAWSLDDGMAATEAWARWAGLL